jgi:hypothetical protein
MAIFLNPSRRQLLSSAATISVAGIAPDVVFDVHARSEITQQAQALAPPSEEAQAQTFSSVTSLRPREIAERNRVRQEACLPLLSYASGEDHWLKRFGREDLCQAASAARWW